MCASFYDRLPHPGKAGGDLLAAIKMQLTPREIAMLFIIAENPLVKEGYATLEGVIGEAQRLAKSYPQFTC
jgi:hypothetical protein